MSIGPTLLENDKTLAEPAQYAAQLARAAFEAGRYDVVARQFLAAGTDNVHAALWGVRALIEIEEYKDAAARAAHWAEHATGSLAGGFHALEALARLYRGDPIHVVDTCIDRALAVGSAMGHVVRASIHVAYNQYRGGADELARVATADLDPYETQIHLLVSITIAACLRDGTMLRDARAELNRFLAGNSGLHYLGWSAFAVARTHFIQGDFQLATAGFEQFAELVTLSASKRFHRGSEMIRDLMLHGDPWRFTSPGNDQTTYVPRSMALQAAVGRPLDVALQRRPVLNQLYATFVEAGTAGLSKDDIMVRLWGVSFDPIRHESRVYKAVGRLRAVLDECYGGSLAAVGSKYVLRQAPV